jgi:hypothetical protein
LKRTIDNRGAAVAALSCLAWLFVCIVPAAAHPRPVEDNLDRLLTAADSAAVLCGGTLRFLPEEKVLWMEERNGDALGRFLLTRVAAGLSWNGIRLSAAGKPQSGTSGLLLTLGKASVLYQNQAASGLPGDAPILRITEIEVTARLERADTVLTDTVAVRLEDRIAGSDLDFVERRGIPATRPDKPEGGSWFRMIVPALIVASVGWMVYSFYSIRSQ